MCGPLLAVLCCKASCHYRANQFCQTGASRWVANHREMTANHSCDMSAVQLACQSAAQGLQGHCKSVTSRHPLRRALSLHAMLGLHQPASCLQVKVATVIMTMHCIWKHGDFSSTVRLMIHPIQHQAMITEADQSLLCTVHCQCLKMHSLAQWQHLKWQHLSILGMFIRREETMAAGTPGCLGLGQESKAAHRMQQLTSWCCHWRLGAAFARCLGIARGRSSFQSSHLQRASSLHSCSPGNCTVST